MSLLRGDKTFPGIGSPSDIHHERDEILQAVDVIYLAKTCQRFLYMLILVGLVNAEEYELSRLGCFFNVVPFLVKVLDMRVRDTEDQAPWARFRQLQHRLSRYVGACAQELDQDILHREEISLSN